MTVLGTSTLLQVSAPAVPSNAWEMVKGGEPLTQAVFALLVVLSLVSWAVMLAKWREFRRARRSGDRFLNEFEHAHSLEEAARSAARAEPGPHTRVFSRALQFLQDTKPAMGATPDRAPRYSGSQVEALRLVLDTETNAERDRLAHMLPWLATIGAVSPLIGLLGTVLGVISAFLGIAESGSGNLSAVAPGVAEALVATALALAVAIPAVFGYNVFASRLNRIDGELEGFGSELIALLVREGRM
ncbi:MAG TPA: MotA/TolQ/ExbB proton channel family protein [Gemmatimonadaceae bacterium]|nr:MotA/TolQ/ExbB proton channel family protein [Gemmatimonadaceae bacterium]